MKKVLIVLVAGILSFTMSLIPLQAVASASSLTSYGEGNVIVGDCKGKNVSLSDQLSGLMVANQSELVIIGNNDFKIEIGNMVKDFEVIDDVDNDGVKDVAVYVDSDDDYDDFKVISSKTSKVLFATKYSYKTLNQNNEEITVNSTIRQILYNDKVIYLIYDHHLTAISSEDFKTKFDYVGDDNLWKMIVFENQLIFTDQLGQITSIDKKSGDLKYQSLLALPLEIKPQYGDTEVEAKLNTWDLLLVDNKLYVTSDEGKLYLVEPNWGSVAGELTLSKDAIDILKKELANGYISNDYVSPIGINNKIFMAFKMQLINDDLMLVSAYLGDKGVAASSSENKAAPMLILVDLKEMTVKSTISLEQYNLMSSEAVVGIYDGQEAFIVPTYANAGKLRIMAYSISDGSVLGQSDLMINVPEENVKLTFSKHDDRYLLQIIGGSSLLISNDLKSIEYLGNAKIVNRLADVNDGTLVTVRNDSKITQIKKLGLGGKDDVIINVDVPSTYRNNGFEAINYDEKHNQILSLVNEINELGEITASHIVIINLSDGTIVTDKKVLLEKGRDENNKYFEHYLIGASIEYFVDMNNDGKLEVLVDDSILDGATMTYRSIYNKSFEGAVTIIEVGDLNNDGISDIVNVGESEMRLYYSSKNGYDITYQKSNIAKSYDKKLLNNQYVKVIGDLDHDGVNEFVINDYNDQRCQYYQVINAKDLSLRFTLLKDGVYDAGESFRFTGIDYNHDGVDDILYQSPEQSHLILNGVNGETIGSYRLENEERMSTWDPSPLDNLVEFSINKESNGLVAINDINEDGLNEWAYLVYNYDYNDGRNEATYLKILDGKNFEEIKMIKLENEHFSYNPLITIVGQDKLIYQTDDLSQIYDYKQETLVAGLNVEVKNAKGLNTGEIQLEDNNGQLYSFLDQRDFELVDFDNKAVSNGDLTINYKSDKSGLMSVYDQGKLIEKTTSKTLKLKLVTGGHKLTFSYNDGHGKITHYSTSLCVEKSSISRYLILLVSLFIVAGGFGLVYYPKYRLLKKAGVKHG